jgi:hypothetical protein
MSQSLSNWIIFLLAGKVIIYLWQQFPLPALLEKYKTVEKLHSCDLCAGVWIYGILSLFLGMSLLEVLGFSYIPVVSEVVTGGIISFVVHIFSIGWKEKFNDILVV